MAANESTSHDGIVYKRATKEEKVSLSRLQNFVFNLNMGEKETREEIEKSEDKDGVAYCALDGNGRLLAGIYVFPFSMWFDGRRVSMAGIGGVASEPQCRRQGLVRNLMVNIFNDIHDNGTVFSHLFPFSLEYYRQFGYETCGGVRRYTLPVAPARRLKCGGTAHEFVKGDPVRDKLVEVYEAFASRHNAMLSRPLHRWDHVFDIPLFSAERLYYWADDEQNVKAWAKFKHDGKEIKISDIVWADHEGMLGILQFMGMFEGASEKIAFVSSHELIAEFHWPDLYSIGIENWWLGMSRVVDAKRALELMEKPGGEEGRFTIKVSDGFAKWNNGVYAVEYGRAGECEARLLKAEPGAGADIEASERALAQLALGVFGLEQIARRDDVRINGNAKTLGKVFRKKHMLITDHF